jgi:membrane protein
MKGKKLVGVAKNAFRKWQKEKASLRAAALAFFIALPMPSLLLFVDEVFIFVYGPAQGTERLSELIGTFTGPTVQSLFSQLIQSTVSPFTSIFGSIASIIFAFAGAVGAFLVLQDTLNSIWGVEYPQKSTLKMRIKERIIPFFYVLGATAMVVLWTTFAAFLFNSAEAAAKLVVDSFAAYVGLFVLQTILSFATATLLFAIIFKELPDTVIKWRDVAIAAIITAIAFTVLNNVFGLYLRSFPVTTVAGAAGALIFLLLWLFVIGEILLYGAHFSKCYTEEMGSHAKLHLLSKKEPPSNRPNLAGLHGQAKSATQITKTSTTKTLTVKPQKEPQPIVAPTKTEPIHVEPKPKIDTEKPVAAPEKAESSKERFEGQPLSLYNEVKKRQEAQQAAAAHKNEQIFFELEKKKDKTKPEP